MLEVTDATFNNEVLDSEQPVVVDFWAPWCGPCKMLGPVLAEVAKEHADRVKFVKINVDETKVSAKYNVRGIPTLMLFKNGDLVDTLVGLQSHPRLSAWLMTNL